MMRGGGGGAGGAGGAGGEGGGGGGGGGREKEEKGASPGDIQMHPTGLQIQTCELLLCSGTMFYETKKS